MMRRPMRGGLVRGVARTAVVAGTASAVAGGVQHHQQKRWAKQDAEAEMLAQQQYGTPQQQYAPPPQQQYAAPPQQYAPPPQEYAPPPQQYAPPPQQAYEAPPAQQAAPTAPAADVESPTVQQLERLAELHTSGALSDDEFASAKQRVLAGE